jgi:cell division transport system ATP-binding protein
MDVLQKVNKSGTTIIMATHDYAMIMKYPSKTLRCVDKSIFEVVQERI